MVPPPAWGGNLIGDRRTDPLPQAWEIKCAPLEPGLINFH